MTKIKSLTDAQWATIYEQREIWLQRGLTTDPAPRADVELAINAIRVFAGQQARPTLWFDGPATAIVFQNLWDNLGDNLRDNLWATWSVPPCFYGSSELYWIAHYVIAHENIKPMHTTEQMTQLRQWAITAQAGWWFPFKNINIICEPPSAIHREDGRLHCETGPAVAFRDDWKHYSIRGVTVNEQIVMRPDTQTLEQIGKEQNAEVKRIRIERFGWKRYLREVNATVVHQRRNDVDMTHECLMRCDGMTVLVGACPSTGRVYAMEVDPNLETCEHAQAWLRNSSNGFCVGAS